MRQRHTRPVSDLHERERHTEKEKERETDVLTFSSENNDRVHHSLDDMDCCVESTSFIQVRRESAEREALRAAREERRSRGMETRMSSNNPINLSSENKNGQGPDGGTEKL